MNKSNCWYCGQSFEYDGEQYRETRCTHCGTANRIYNPSNTTEIEGGEDMGKLADRAREKSPYLKLDIGEESKPMIYKSWKEITDNFGNESFRYMFELETESGLVLKQLDNRSSAFAESMDKIEFGVRVIVARQPKLDHEGEPIENKSVWTVRKAE